MRWVIKACNKIETPKVDAFLLEVDEVCKRHGFCIGHEDSQGGFIIYTYKDGDPDWLQEATVCINEDSLL